MDCYTLYEWKNNYLKFLLIDVCVVYILLDFLDQQNLLYT